MLIYRIGYTVGFNVAMFSNFKRDFTNKYLPRSGGNPSPSSYMVGHTFECKVDLPDRMVPSSIWLFGRKVCLFRLLSRMHNACTTAYRALSSLAPSKLLLLKHLVVATKFLLLLFCSVQLTGRSEIDTAHKSLLSIEQTTVHSPRPSSLTPLLNHLSLSILFFFFFFFQALSVCQQSI